MRSGLTRAGNAPALYSRILYDTELEARAFDRLREFDLGGCRKALGQLVFGLDLSRVEDGSAQVVQLLVDILHKLNQRIHPGPDQDGRYQANRVALIEQFADCESAENARDRFLAALNRMLAPLQSLSGSDNPLVERARSHIARHYQQRLSLSSVADELHISANYLSRLFRRETGITLTTFIQRVRLEHAMLMLAEGGLSISEIAYRVGYQNYRDFYRNFVKYQHASPRQVRRRLARDPRRRPRSADGSRPDCA